MGNYHELKVWQRGKALAVWMYQTTGEGKFTRDFGLRDQIRRAVVSIPSNIAEGDELHTHAQAIRHFYIAKGSTAEVLTQSIIAFEIGYITSAQYQHIEQECKTIAGMLTRLIRSRQINLPPCTLHPAPCPPSNQTPRHTQFQQSPSRGTQS